MMRKGRRISLWSLGRASSPCFSSGMSDSAKRLRSKLVQLAEQSAALFEQYMISETSSFGALVSSYNLAERYTSLGPATGLGTLHVAELFGPLVAFDGVPQRVVESIRLDAHRQRARVFTFVDAMQSLHEKLRGASCAAQQALEAAAVTCPLDALSQRSVDEPHCAVDLAAYCDAWEACVAADLSHKTEVMAALPGIPGAGASIHSRAQRSFPDADLSLEADEATDLLCRFQACVSAWVVPRVSIAVQGIGTPQAGPGDSSLQLDSKGVSAGDAGPLRLSPSSYLSSRWLDAGLSFWRFKGRGLPASPTETP